jgi:hypothetical protein
MHARRQNNWDCGGRTPKAAIQPPSAECPLLAQSGHCNFKPMWRPLPTQRAINLQSFRGVSCNWPACGPERGSSSRRASRHSQTVSSRGWTPSGLLRPWRHNIGKCPTSGQSAANTLYLLAMAGFFGHLSLSACISMFITVAARVMYADAVTLS